ncbi:hypothetical protein N7471_004965 [Penicillium samsonianum]|uniref:uncharacterized protein n=1 Tax=Penicillium samsonianum TaxID=1882272 RepID=UPI0025473F6B|nr:uncharacterized protein N7471_004965 [Penicillium samsonianum]KAJ6138479.1 hypothetical protein N7471_004965 [Penicillium samsonianum]
MHFYQKLLTFLAFGATLVAAQITAGVVGGSTQLCTLPAVPPFPAAFLACPEQSLCTSDGSGCTGARHNALTDQCT